MIPLRFDVIAADERVAEPVQAGIPLPPGALTDPARLRIRDRGRPMPVQTRVLSTWPDGSVRWILAIFQPDLPGAAAKDLICDLDGCEPAPARETIRIEESDSGWVVDVGPMQVTVLRDGFDLLHEVKLDGRTLLAAGGSNRGFFYEHTDGPRQDMASGALESAEWVESGPLRAWLTMRGEHGGGDAPGLKYRVSLKFFAGKPWVQIQYQAVLADPRESVDLTHWGLRISDPTGKEADRRRADSRVYGPDLDPDEPDPPTEALIGRELAQSSFPEQIAETMAFDFCADWTHSDTGGVAVSVYQALQNFPKALRSTPEALEIDLLPATEPPLTLRRGVGKTHFIQLHFHGPEVNFLDVSRRSFLFQIPDIPMLDPETYAASGAFLDRFPTRRFDRLDYHMHHRAMCVPRAFGMLHYGDYVEQSYTRQNRGRGRPVWCNNEYDPPHVYYLLHCLFQERWLRDHAAAAARHMMDVDFCHSSDDPLRQGGVIHHSADHVSGHVSMSHEWSPGLLDHYHFTGDPEALEKAVAIGENVLRRLQQPKHQDPKGRSTTRETGWALRSLGPLWVETRDPRFREACEWITDKICRDIEKSGGLLDRYFPHTLGRVPFMISLTVESLRQWGEISGDNRIPAVIERLTRDMLEETVGLAGLPYYKMLPSLHQREPTSHNIHPFTEAWRLTGDERFLRVAYRTVEILLERGCPNPRTFHNEAFEDATLIGGASWATIELETILFFYAALSEDDNSNGRPILAGLDYRAEF